MIILALLLLTTTFVVSAVITAVVKHLALRTGFVAHPTVDRFHKRTVPLGGGIAIFATIALVLLSAMAAGKFLLAAGRLDFLGEAVTIHTQGLLSRTPELLMVLLFMFVLHILGLWDDKKKLTPVFKLAVQFAAAFAMAFFAEIRVEMFIESKIITSLLSAFWIVLIINAFNFLDNMDGLSAGVALIVSAVLFTVAAMNGQLFVSAMAIILIGTLAGFLLFNFPPAKIFMGDAGSLIVGALVAMLSLRTTYYSQAESGRFYAVFVPLVVMAVPLYDFISVTLLRISQGKSPFVGDTQHFSHRLKRRGLTETQTVLTLYLATLCTALTATLLPQVNAVGAILIAAETLMILAIITILEMSTNDKKSEQ